MFIRVFLKSALENYDSENKLLFDIFCNECSTPIDFMIMETVNSHAAGSISVRSALGGNLDSI